MMNLLQKAAIALLLGVIAAPLTAAECVVLLHGLARTSNSLNKISNALVDQGYLVANINYPSRSAPVEELAAPAIERGLQQCSEARAEQVSFVTHSMGGILVRYYLENEDIASLHRVVMLAPPNQGSGVVDAIGDVPGYRLLNGPAGQQLGTGKDSLPLALGPVNFDLGVIAGNRTINLVLSQFLENPDDGKVSVANTRVEGMCGFIEMPVTHAMMMLNDAVIGEVLAYLQTGAFAGENAENGLCGF